MSSRFQPRGGIQSTFASAAPAIVPTAADETLAAQQLTAYEACNELVASVSLGDVRKNEAAQLTLLAINVPFTASSLPAGTTAVGWLGQTDWTATLTVRKVTLATLR